MNYYEVAVTRIVREGVSFLTYSSEGRLEVGSVVKVPVGSREIVGVVFKEVGRPDFETKMVSGVVEGAVLPKRLLDVASWMSEYYATALPLVMQAMLPAGVEKKRRERKVEVGRERRREEILLNKNQRRAVREIEESAQSTVLLHGITGSGKTNVYAKLVAGALGRRKSTIVLVPEIALTSQIVEVLGGIFGEKVCLIHSMQTEAERHLVWQKIMSAEEPMVVVGPRSALFAPVKELGVVVIDEAHEASYKQDQAPKYNALRVAAAMAKRERVKVVLGTATPAVSDYYLAKKSGAVVEMKQLAVEAGGKAEVKVVDLKRRENFQQQRFLSNAMLGAIEKSLAEGRQCLVFHNRRGSASVTICGDCGWQALCEDCRLPLVLHGDLYKFLCHSCGREYRVVTRCPECQNTEIVHKGVGTKLIEQELRRMFSGARVARFDGDTPNEAMLSDPDMFAAVKVGEVQIVVGTQVVAKGLDLPKLGMVGVVQADLGLSLPDFTSEERVFQLLSQVVGRAKRGHGDTVVVVQTYQPESEAVRLGVEQDYAGFYEYELTNRRRGGFPPYQFLLKLTCVYKTEAACIRNVRRLANELRREFPNVQVLGPMPDFHEHRSNGYRWQIVVKSRRRADLVEIAKRSTGAHWQFDLDPSSLL